MKHLFVSMSVKQKFFVSVFVHKCLMLLNDVENTTFKMFVTQMSNYVFVISFQLMFYETLRCSLARPLESQSILLFLTIFVFPYVIDTIFVFRYVFVLTSVIDTNVIHEVVIFLIKNCIPFTTAESVGFYYRDCERKKSSSFNSVCTECFGVGTHF